MSFLKPQIVHGQWVKVDGSSGTEFVSADLIGQIDEYDGPAIPVPEPLSQFAENRMATEIKVVTGWGCRLSAPGFMDCTPWTVFDTEQEAVDYLAEQAEDEQIDGDDDE